MTPKGPLSTYDKAVQVAERLSKENDEFVTVNDPRVEAEVPGLHSLDEPEGASGTMPDELNFGGDTLSNQTRKLKIQHHLHLQRN